jgi:hypothetical protein
MPLASEWGTGQVFLEMIWFFLFILWIWLLIDIFADIIRSRDLSGWGKAGWTIFVIVLPFLGVFVYLIARGHKMSEHKIEAAQARETQFREYVQQAATHNGHTTANELTHLAELREKGVLSDPEFERAKAKALS